MPALERSFHEGEAILSPEEKAAHEEARSPAEAQLLSLLGRFLEAGLHGLLPRACHQGRAVQPDGARDGSELCVIGDVTVVDPGGAVEGMDERRLLGIRE